mmetsp:Transcript_9830/g.21217  ORF Transcript_9830/g.21217 Transcript_9830/m.21217 type:complete len:120 (-) Transcript_9830:382-741(-)
MSAVPTSNDDEEGQQRQEEEQPDQPEQPPRQSSSDINNEDGPPLPRAGTTASPTFGGPGKQPSVDANGNDIVVCTHCRWMCCGLGEATCCSILAGLGCVSFTLGIIFLICWLANPSFLS